MLSRRSWNLLDTASWDHPTQPTSSPFGSRRQKFDPQFRRWAMIPCKKSYYHGFTTGVTPERRLHRVHQNCQSWRGSGHATRPAVPRLALPFIVHVEEGLVSSRWDHPEKPPNWLFVKRVLRSGGVEEIPRAATELVRLNSSSDPCKLVGAALGHDVNDGAAIPPVLSLSV